MTCARRLLSGEAAQRNLVCGRSDDVFGIELNERPLLVTVASRTKAEVVGMSGLHPATLTATVFGESAGDVLRDPGWNVHADIARRRLIEEDRKVVLAVGGTGLTDLDRVIAK